jgi:hypothetical protein
VTNTAEGRRYLESTLLTVPGSPYTAGEISRAFFQALTLTCIKSSGANVDTIDAIAFVLSELNIEKKAQAISEAAMIKLDI